MFCSHSLSYHTLFSLTYMGEDIVLVFSSFPTPLPLFFLFFLVWIALLPQQGLHEKHHGMLLGSNSILAVPPSPLWGSSWMGSSLPDQHSCPIVLSIHIYLLPGTTGTLHLCFRK